jgi:predicted phage replisome organizer
MADEVKWIKITTSMFDDEKIRVIHDFPEGAEILLIWVKLLCMAGKVNANGYIFISENIPYTENSLASVLHSPLNTVKLALGTFENMGMITRDGKGIFINNFAYYQNQTALQILRDKWANDKRLARHQAKQLKVRVVLDKVSDNVLDKSKTNQQIQAQSLNKASNVLDKSETPLKDIDKERDIDIDVDKEKGKKRIPFNPPSNKEVSIKEKNKTTSYKGWPNVIQ